MECEKHSCIKLQETSHMTFSIITKKPHDTDVASLLILPDLVLKKAFSFHGLFTAEIFFFNVGKYLVNIICSRQLYKNEALLTDQEMKYFIIEV